MLESTIEISQSGRDIRWNKREVAIHRIASDGLGVIW
jgi:hypothetical protein